MRGFQGGLSGKGGGAQGLKGCQGGLSGTGWGPEGLKGSQGGLPRAPGRSQGVLRLRRHQTGLQRPRALGAGGPGVGPESLGWGSQVAAECPRLLRGWASHGVPPKQGPRGVPIPYGPPHTALSVPAPSPSEHPPPAPEGEAQVLDLQMEVPRPAQQSVVEYSPSLLGQVTVRELMEDAQDAVSNANLSTLGSAAAVSGGAVVLAAVAVHMLASMNQLPVLPEAMKAVGLVYCSLVVREHWTQERLRLAPSPLGFMSDVMGRKTHLPASEILSRLPEQVDERVGARLQELLAERDRALAQLEVLKQQEAEMARARAEKDALEAVAVRLAGERDNALEEVTALRTAVSAMTERMKAIEGMLAQEVQRLQEQNKALETVALQLADERDKAITQVGQLQGAFEKQREEDKKVLEVLATQLIEERNNAAKEAQELRLVVARLMRAAAADSELPAEMEALLKSRVQAVSPHFVDVTKPYSIQAGAVDRLVTHLAEEYGAPREWTSSYIQQLLDKTSSGQRLGV